MLSWKGKSHCATKFVKTEIAMGMREKLKFGVIG